MIIVCQMQLADAMSVIERMRPQDWDCLHSLRGFMSAEAFAVDRWGTDGPAWVVMDGALPVCVGGLTFHSEWLAVAWFIATPDMRPETWRKVIRHARTVFSKASDPSFEHYRHRIEAHVMADWAQAQNFAKRLGFSHEGARRAAGRCGEDIQTWAIVGPPRGKACPTS